MRSGLIITVLIVACIHLNSALVSAKTLILEGKLDGAVNVRQTVEFTVNNGAVSTLSFRFALPATFQSRTVSQSIENFDVAIHPRPTSSVVETDQFGNRFQKVSWNNVNQNVRIHLEYIARVRSELSALESRAPFPLGSQNSSESKFLQSSDMVQASAPAIAALARQLTGNAKNEYEAVMAVTNWVSDNIKYTFNPPKYDASYTLETKSGNCQNFAHLSIALLRSVGIPARIVGGFTLKNSWKVPIDARNSIVQNMGQGGHAWLEVWFPDLGWLPYDPQQSKQFTSTRHFKQSHGLDSRDINDTWRGAPYLPAYSESFEGRYTTDTVDLKMKRFDAAPRSYLLSNLFAVATGTAIVDQYETPPVQIRTEPSQLPDPPVTRPVKTEKTPDPKPVKKVVPPADPVVRPQPPVKQDPLPVRQESSEIPVTPDEEELLRPPQPVPQLKPPKPVKPAKPPKPAKPVKVVKKPPNAAKPHVVATKPTPPAKPAETVAAATEPLQTKPILPAKPVEPVTVTAEPLRKKLLPGSVIVFGNTEFPSLLHLYQVQGDTGTRIFERETSEYVSSRHIFAQAMQVKDKMSLDRISLAMRKFGGDGSVYIDLVRDKDGKPDVTTGIRSNLIDLERITRKPGYYWVDFSFPMDGNKPQQLTPGKYWIVFRASGEAIMNWFFTPGKPYGMGDDTRSTAKGYQWEDILNFDFVFKVSGKAL